MIVTEKKSKEGKHKNEKDEHKAEMKPVKDAEHPKGERKPVRAAPMTPPVAKTTTIPPATKTAKSPPATGATKTSSATKVTKAPKTPPASRDNRLGKTPPAGKTTKIGVTHPTKGMLCTVLFMVHRSVYIYPPDACLHLDASMHIFLKICVVMKNYTPHAAEPKKPEKPLVSKSPGKARKMMVKPSPPVPHKEQEVKLRAAETSSSPLRSAPKAPRRDRIADAAPRRSEKPTTPATQQVSNSRKLFF